MILNALKLAIIAIAISAFITGCGLSTQEAQKEAAKLLQQTIDENKELKKYQLKVSSVTLVKESDSKFTGIAKIEHDGAMHDVAITFLSDSNNMVVKTDQGAFLFLLKSDMEKGAEEMQKIGEEAERQIGLIQRQLENLR